MVALRGVSSQPCRILSIHMSRPPVGTSPKIDCQHRECQHYPACSICHCCQTPTPSRHWCVKMAYECRWWVQSSGCRDTGVGSMHRYIDIGAVQWIISVPSSPLHPPSPPSTIYRPPQHWASHPRGSPSSTDSGRGLIGDAGGWVRIFGARSARCLGAPVSGQSRGPV